MADIEARLPRAGWHRRPSGDPPPLPRGAGWRPWAWGTLALLAVGTVLHVAINPSDAEAPLLRWFQDLRTPRLVDVADLLDDLTQPLPIWILRVAIVVVAALFKRWRHIVTLLALFVVVDFVVAALAIERVPP